MWAYEDIANKQCSCLLHIFQAKKDQPRERRGNGGWGRGPYVISVSFTGKVNCIFFQTPKVEP